MGRSFSRATLAASLAVVCLTGRASLAQGAESPQKSSTMALADGQLELKVPAAWVRKKPRNSIIEQEFAIPASKGDPRDGRITVMGAGGGVEANIERWVGQFAQPDGSQTKAKQSKRTIAGQEVHLVDLSGTYKDSAGPLAPAVERENYRMLAAIVVTPNSGSYFIKLYGPKQTVADNEAAWRKMIEGMTKK